MTAETLITPRIRLRDRLVARVASRALDDQIAQGVEPDARPALTLRAQRLIGPQARTALARQLRRIVADAQQDRVGLQALVPARAGQVRDAADQLRLLADRLASRRPVTARGVAQVRLLLTDPGSPMYHRGAGEAVQALAIRALDELEPDGVLAA
jgi:hypothetical protein